MRQVHLTDAEGGQTVLIPVSKLTDSLGDWNRSVNPKEKNLPTLYKPVVRRGISALSMSGGEWRLTV